MCRILTHCRSKKRFWSIVKTFLVHRQKFCFCNICFQCLNTRHTFFLLTAVPSAKLVSLCRQVSISHKSWLAPGKTLDTMQFFHIWAVIFDSSPSCHATQKRLPYVEESSICQSITPVSQSFLYKLAKYASTKPKWKHLFGIDIFVILWSLFLQDRDNEAHGNVDDSSDIMKSSQTGLLSLLTNALSAGGQDEFTLTELMDTALSYARGEVPEVITGLSKEDIDKFKKASVLEKVCSDFLDFG